MRRSRGRTFVLGAVFAALLAAAPAALADFPYSRPGSDTTDPTDLYLDPGQTPADLVRGKTDRVRNCETVEGR